MTVNDVSCGLLWFTERGCADKNCFRRLDHTLQCFFTVSDPGLKSIIQI